jgi:hypothetical protein
LGAYFVAETSLNVGNSFNADRLPIGVRKDDDTKRLTPMHAGLPEGHH